MPPVNVTARTLGPHSVQVSWSLPKSLPNSKHEATKSIIVYAESGDWNDTWEPEAGMTSVTVSGLSSCSAVKMGVAAKGDEFISERTFAPTAWTPLQVLS